MKTLRFIGLDVHKDSIAMAVAEGDGSVPALAGVIPNDTRVLVQRLRKLGRGGSLRCCYEAGPTGYGLQRDLTAAGIDCIVVAPSLIPVQPSNRVKTDRRDALKLARFLRSGDLTAVTVPDVTTEAMRDLERAREDAMKAQTTARHQLGKFLLRHGRSYAGKTRWGTMHLRWVEAQHFEHEAQRRVLAIYLHTVYECSKRVAQLTADIGELATSAWQLAPLVKSLQALRGVRLVNAVTIAAELGDLARFPKPTQLMAYVGLVPTEHSSGESKRRGHITKAGNSHVRRALIEAAWGYRFSAALSNEIRERNEDVAPPIRAIAWKAQQRLCRRYRRMTQRGVCKQKTVTAVARELCGFIWAIGQQQLRLAQ